MNKTRHSKTLKAVLLSAVLCLAVSCTEEGVSSSSASQAVMPQVEAAAALETPDIEQHDINPLTGLAPIEGQAEGTRPIALMIDNNPLAVPQTGISAADVIYEMETIGGSTDLMALYSDPNAIVAAGPITSISRQFAELAMAQNAVLVNIDSDIYAENLLNYYGYQNVDGMYLGTTAFSFDLPRSYEKGNEYSWYTNSGLITGAMATNSISSTGGYNPLFNFAAEGADVADGFEGDAQTAVNFNFSATATGELRYNSATQSYDKYIGGAVQADSIEQKTLSFNNVLILFCDVTKQSDNHTLNFVLTQGEGVYITGGKYQNISWQKGYPDDQLILFNDAGESIPVATGKSYIAFVSTTQKDSLVIS